MPRHQPPFMDERAAFTSLIGNHFDPKEYGDQLNTAVYSALIMVWLDWDSAVSLRTQYPKGNAIV
jgi:hypothetical protein